VAVERPATDGVEGRAGRKSGWAAPITTYGGAWFANPDRPSKGGGPSVPSPPAQPVSHRQFASEPIRLGRTCGIDRRRREMR
jgi:hypothetical protein